jgi:type I restriction enzyme S subunit
MSVRKARKYTRNARVHLFGRRVNLLAEVGWWQAEVVRQDAAIKVNLGGGLGMEGEWKTKTLNQLGRIVTGKTPPSSAVDAFGGNIPFITPSDMNGARTISTTARTLSTSGRSLVKNAAIPKNAVMVSCIGSDMGKAALAGTDCVTNQQINSIIIETDDSPLFVYYNLSTRKSEICGSAGGSAQPILSKSAFGRFEIDLPPLPEQRAIAHILGTLDDKIELNRRRNQTLEAMARALFKDWFVDFGPIRAKMEGREPYLPDELWQLFPDRLDDEGKPEGWERKKVGECFSLTMGQSPPGDTYNDIGDGLPFFQGKTDFGFRYPENRKYCSAPTRIANAEDTLVSVRAPVGDINLAWEKCCIGRGVAAVRHASGARSFTYHAIWSLQEELKQFEHTGTVFGAINRKQFEVLPFVEPDQRLIDFYERVCGALDDKVRNNTEDSRTLAQLRDTLLPKLISGELRIEDAEKFLENAL